MLAQRFPADFDGIVVGAPVLNFSGTMVAYANDVQALRAAPIPAAKLPLLAEKIYAQCDARDGLKDGLIAGPRAAAASRPRAIFRNAMAATSPAASRPRKSARSRRFTATW